MSKKSAILLLSILLFVICLRVGFWVSQKKPLWGDEIQTQVRTIDQKSFSEIFLRQFPEGNTNPLFYVMQKSIAKITNFTFPEGKDDNWKVSDQQAQFVMRIVPVVCVSLAVVILFLYFSWRYSFWVGIYSVLTFFSTQAIWIYWAEARPYGLWLFLSMVQTILMLLIFELQERNKLLIGLCIVNVFLSLTIVVSIAQIFISGLILIVFNRINFKDLLLVFGVPIGFCLLYRIFSVSNIRLHSTDEMINLILSNISLDSLILIIFSVLWIFFTSVFSGRKEQKGFSNFIVGLDFKCLMYFILMLLSAVGLIVCINITSIENAPAFYVPDRYFMFLVPIGIVTITKLTQSVMKSFKGSRWMMLNGVIVFSGFLLFRMLKTYYFILQSKYF